MQLRVCADVAEVEPDVAIILAARMLEPTICAPMSLGTPATDVAGLADLDRLLQSLGLRRTCSDEPERDDARRQQRRRFWSELEPHLEARTRKVVDVQVHGTTGETPN